MAGIQLIKGQTIDLTKGRSGLTNVIVGLGWDPAETGGKQGNIDCDASALLLNPDGKLTRKSNLVWFHNQHSACHSVVHTGDNLTGEGEGDDEQIRVNLSAVPSDISRILVIVNIYEAEERGQDFGMIRSAYIRVMNAAGGAELVRYNLSDSCAGYTALICGELCRHQSEWMFKAIGEGSHASHINQLVERYI